MKKTAFGFLLLLFYTVAVSYNGKQHQELPASLQASLSQHQQQDDISGWIYDLLDWFAADPSNRINDITDKIPALWRQPNTPGEIQAWLDLIINQAYGHLFAGDIIASTDVYQKAYQFAANHPEIVEEELVLEHILKPLGNNYTRLGDYEQAMFIHEKAKTLASRHNAPSTMAGILSNMANTAMGMGDYKQARQYCKEALQLEGMDAAVHGLVLSELAEAEQGLGFIAAGRTAIQKSLRLLRSAGNTADNWLFMAYQKASDLYLSEPRIAKNYLEKAGELQQQLSLTGKVNIRARETAKLFYRRTALELQQHNLQAAARWADACLHVLLPSYNFSNLPLDAIYGENTLVDLFYAKAIMTKNAMEQMKYFQACFTAEKKLRSSFITGAAREKAIADTRKRYEHAIAAAFEAYRQTKEPKYQELMVLFMEGSKSQILLHEMSQTAATGSYNGANDSLHARVRLLEQAVVYFEKELQQPDIPASQSVIFHNKKKQANWDLSMLKKKLYPANTAEDRKNSFSVKALQALLKEDQRMRLYFTGATDMYCAELDAHSIRFATKMDMPAHWSDTVQSFLQTYFENGANAILDAPAKYYATAHSIYQQLTRQQDFEAGRHYILLPDGFLNNLPFEALLTKPDYTHAVQDWPYLLYQSLFTYAWSLETFYQQLKYPSKGIGAAGLFLSHANTSQAELAAVKKEYETLLKILPAAALLQDSQATVSAFKAAFTQSALLHLSTHAYIAPGYQTAPKMQLYDAAFYQFETRLLQQHPALVLLNACKTGAGKQLTGEGVQSMARSFIANGTNAVVAGWWNVHDAAASQLMQSFYTNIYKQISPAKALQQAKIQWLQHEAVHYAQKLPYFWAALNYHGNPHPDLSALHQTLQLGEHQKITTTPAKAAFAKILDNQLIRWSLTALAAFIAAGVIFFLYKRARKTFK